MLERVLQSRINPLRNLLRAMVSRALVRAAAQQGLEVVQLEQAPGDLLGAVEVFGHYGFTSATLPNAEAIRVYVRGAPDHPVVVATADRRHRPTNLAPGDVALHNDKGDRVWLKSSRELQASVAGASLTINGSSIAVTGAGGSTITLAVGSVSIAIAASGVTITAPSGVTTFT